MKRFFALLLVLSLIACFFVGCGNKDNTTANDNTPTESDSANSTESQSADPSDFKIGVILIGDENEAYTAAHIDGIEAAKEALGLSDDAIIYKYGIPEDETCYDTAIDLVEQGCKLIFANSFSHESYLFQAAEENPDVLFAHTSGTMAADSGLDNVCNYFTDVYQSRYVSGVVAGLKLKELMDAGTVTDPYIGYVGAFPYAEVISGYTAFFLGVRSIVPEAHMDVQYINSWYDVTAEATAADALIAKGCVIIGQHTDSTGAPTAVQAALDDGTVCYSIGYNIDMLSVSPTGCLTSSQNNWGVLYETIIRDAMETGAFATHDYTAGYEEGAVQISALGQSCAEGTAEKVAEVEQALHDGTLHVFDTSTFTVDGKTLDSYDQAYGYEGNELIWDGYFHESELRSAPLFDIPIDGITDLGA